MAARIVHFGVDESFRLAILSRAGFQIEHCDTSLRRFETAIQKMPEVDAVVLSEDEGKESLTTQAIALARLKCTAPVIVFRSPSLSVRDTGVDLVIPNLTQPDVWLQNIKKAIRRSRAIVRHSKNSRQVSAELRGDSAEIRKDVANQRERSEASLSRLHRQLEEHGSEE